MGSTRLHTLLKRLLLRPFLFSPLLLLFLDFFTRVARGLYTRERVGMGGSAEGREGSVLLPPLSDEYHPTGCLMKLLCARSSKSKTLFLDLSCTAITSAELKRGSLPVKRCEHYYFPDVKVAAKPGVGRVRLHQAQYCCDIQQQQLC